MKKNIKKWAAVLTAACMMMTMCACGTDEKTTSGTDKNAKENTAAVDQMGEPESGDQIAVMEIEGMGTIRIRLFEEQAPKAVENFVEHAKDGYYDGVTFHRVIEDFMIQGGDPTGTGRGGESIWGEEFENENCEDLIPIRGALCMANAGMDTNGSQFFIVQASDTDVSSSSVELTDGQKQKFEENGGTPWLVGGYTVFGQVLEGMEVVDEIAAVETNDNDKPLKDVVMKSVTIETAP